MGETKKKEELKERVHRVLELCRSLERITSSIIRTTDLIRARAILFSHCATRVDVVLVCHVQRYQRIVTAVFLQLIRRLVKRSRHQQWACHTFFERLTRNGTWIVFIPNCRNLELFAVMTY